jgi:hypothetical protein
MVGVRARFYPGTFRIEFKSIISFMNQLEGRDVNKVEDTVFPGHVMKAYRGSAAVAPVILNPSGRLYSPAAFSSGKNSGIHSVGG